MRVRNGTLNPPSSENRSNCSHRLLLDLWSYLLGPSAVSGVWSFRYTGSPHR